MKFYTSDLHLYHTNIIKLCDRPFNTIDEMNHKIIDNINERCTKNDDLYILGDVGLNKNNDVIGLIKTIKPKLHLIVGNHDHRIIKHEKFLKLFETVKDYAYIYDESYKIYASHYPHAEWDGYWKGWYHFYGHVHNSIAGGVSLMEYLPKAINVGVDLNDFYPKTAEELISARKESFSYPDYDFDTLIRRLGYISRF